MTVLNLLLFSTVVWITRGMYDPSIVILLPCFLIWVWRVTLNRPGFVFEERLWNGLPWFWAILVAVRINVQFFSPEWAFLGNALGAIPFVLLILDFRTQQRKWIFPVLMTELFFLTLYLSPHPTIDVFQSNTLAVDYFLGGLNPYRGSYPDIYHGHYDYRPGFLYFPGALLLQTASHLLFDDIRGVLVLAWGSACFFLRKSSTNFWIWMTVPVLFFQFNQAWLDPVIAFSAALLLVGLSRKSSWISIAAMVLAASVKQYGVLLAVFAFFFVGFRRSWKLAFQQGLASAVGFGLILLPFLISGAKEFYDMTIATHATAHIRGDALSVTAFLLRQFDYSLPSGGQAAAIALGFGIGVWHLARNSKERGLRTLPEAWAIAFGFSILFGKFAFCNYYGLLMSFWILAEIWDGVTIPSEPETLQPST